MHFVPFGTYKHRKCESLGVDACQRQQQHQQQRACMPCAMPEFGKLWNNVKHSWQCTGTQQKNYLLGCTG